MTESAAPSYKDTLNLPKTNFDMKANLLTREPAMLKAWQEQNLYGQIRAARKNAPKGKWVLHDGPPYANGDIHMGHLINKVLKDIVVKFRTMQGYDSPYVPGWDCHGLPIESAIQKELGPKFRELSKQDLRQKCHDYAMKFVHLQAEGFKRLGVFADFERPYLTLDPKYESGILEVLAELVQRDLVYRKKKPVHWCTNDRTALAEAELEYAPRKDTSVYVLFKYDMVVYHEGIPEAWEDFLGKEGFLNGIYLMIWTTTPWTLPANRAVAVHPNHEYVAVRVPSRGTVVIVAKQLVDKVMSAAGVTEYSVSPSITGSEWVAMRCNGVPIAPEYEHPFDGPDCPVVLADYVTLEDGTGLVHTAPGHGTEDYQTGLRNNLEIYNPVLPDGRYDDTVPEFLKGKTIWEANALVIEKLKELGTLFHHQEFDHSYPHCWRCKKPVIFRATEQWFVRASGLAYDLATGNATARINESAVKLWDNAKRFVSSVQFIPHWGKNRLDGMLDTRPDWCISRQRSWGVPIPAFFDEKGNCLLTEKSTRAVAAYFKEHGATSWYTDLPGKILGGTTWTDTAIAPGGGTISDFTFEISKLTKGQDILDVWFESGASHHAVLECTHPELGYPADMYLEGSDQHRGWFQSSLLEAAGYKAEPPFRQVLTHGFIVDDKGRKMSKSEGNDIKVEAALKEFGADILRLWVCSVDYQNDIPCSKELFKTIGEAYRKIRNTIRYLLGNLYDFNPATDLVDPAPHSIDAWMAGRLAAVTTEVSAAYDTYEFHKVFRTLYEFCNVDISSVYAKAIKDRLYCELPADPKRRRSQSVCYRALVALIELSAPVLVYTAEEAFAALKQLPGCTEMNSSIHTCIFSQFNLETSVAGAPMSDPKAEHARLKLQNERLKSEITTIKAGVKHWPILMPLVESGLKQLDDLKKSVGLGNALDAEAVIILPSVEDEVSKLIAEYGPEIEDALGVGFHRIEHGENWDIKIHDTREKYPSCARSWKRRPDVGSDRDYPDLSARDAAVVRKLRV